MSVERALHALQDSIWALTSFCCSPSANIKLNGRTFKIVKLLGEGGFSFVYLAEDSSSGRLYALKKIACPLGGEDYKKVAKEVEAYKRFRHPNIIRCLDTCSTQDPSGEGKIVYLFLPYYSKGNLQDAVNAFALNGGQFAESEMLRLFLGTCRAVQALHHYRPESRTIYPPPTPTNLASSTESGASSEINGPRQASRTPRSPSSESGDNDAEDEELAGDLDNQNRPLIGTLRSSDSSSTLRANDFQSGSAISPLPSPLPVPSPRRGTKRQPWAHRDLKPANIMLDDEGNPILMDFGSALPARIDVPNRSIALHHQDLAAEHCSMPYRAPELFDVKTGVQLTESVDIWSLGCIMFCLAYGHSPFETADTIEQGGSMALAVQNGSWRFPAKDRGYSESIRDMIRSMLVVDAGQRPNIAQVVAMTEAALAKVS